MLFESKIFRAGFGRGGRVQVNKLPYAMKKTACRFLVFLTGTALVLSAGPLCAQEPAEPETPAAATPPVDAEHVEAATGPRPPRAVPANGRTSFQSRLAAIVNTAAQVDPATGLPVEQKLTEQAEMIRISVQWDGLPVTEIIRDLRQRFPAVNFVPTQSLLSDPPIVTLKLRGARLRDVLNAINIATEGRVKSKIESPTLVALLVAPQPKKAVPAPRVEVLNLRDTTHLTEPKQIQEALNEIMEVTKSTIADYNYSRRTVESGDEQPLRAPDFRYHESSGVLVLIGQPEALKIAMQIAGSMRLGRAL